MIKVDSIDKPLDLIVANTMHRCVNDLVTMAPALERLEKAGAKVDIPQSVARLLLREISQEASLELVMACLKMAGAPCSLEDISEGLQAVKDRQKAPVA